MITTVWNRFQWRLAALPAPPVLQEPFSVRRARPDEKEAVRYVALLALKMNTDWHDATEYASDSIEKGIEASFSADHEPTCFVIAHGARIVGTSMVDPALEAVSHLISGPWVLMEYRNRGFGTALLHASLQELINHGINDAYGITRKNAIAARFVYPKFAGIASVYEMPVSRKINSDE
ncbi:MAG: GNAT family N-acetyltransferase [Chthoniobacterales bacterium]